MASAGHAEDARDWVYLHMPAKSFRVKALPGLNLRLRIGNTYAVEDLIARCRGEFPKINRLEELLRDPAQEFFEPAPEDADASDRRNMPLSPALSTPTNRDEYPVEPQLSDYDEVRRQLVGSFGFSEDPSENNDGLLKVVTEMLFKVGLHLQVAEALRDLFSYPLHEVFQSEETRGHMLSPDVKETAKYLAFAAEVGALDDLGSSPQKLKELAAALGRARGGACRRELWRPIRLCIVGRPYAPHVELEKLCQVMALAPRFLPKCEVVPLAERMKILRDAVEV